MEYKDYRTGALINREQYIKNGLERGECLVTYECGCVVIQDRTADAYIVYCPKHEAALDLYEACKAQHNAIDMLFARLIELDKTFFPSKSGLPWDAIIAGNKALAKAEG